MDNLTIITLKEPNITDFAAARNSLLSQAKTDWVLFLDSDETLSKALEQEIHSVLSQQSVPYQAFHLSRLDTFLGRRVRYGEPGHTKLIRLARKDFGHWERPVHEVWRGKGRVGSLVHPILHTPHESIASFLDKINRYSSLEANYRFEQKIKSNLWKIFAYPLAKFKYNYFWLQGFRDGVPGAIMAIMMSFHSYLTWTKLFLLQQKKS